MRRTKTEALQTREAVLRAAAQVIARYGAGGFTIEAVAQEAGLTKGGVLHHFPSKVDLILGLLTQVIEGFQARVTAELAAEPEGQPGRWLRAYIRTVFLADYENASLLPPLAATVAADPQILASIRRSFEESQQAAISDGLDPVQAAIIRLAVDGMVFTRAFGLNVLDAETSRAACEQLLNLTTHTAG